MVDFGKTNIEIIVLFHTFRYYDRDNLHAVISFYCIDTEEYSFGTGDAICNACCSIIAIIYRCHM